MFQRESLDSSLPIPPIMEWNKTGETGDVVNDRQDDHPVNESERSSPRLAASLDNTKFHQAGFARLDLNYIVLGNLMQRSILQHQHFLRKLPVPRLILEQDSFDTGRRIPVWKTWAISGTKE